MKIRNLGVQVVLIGLLGGLALGRGGLKPGPSRMHPVSHSALAAASPLLPAFLPALFPQNALQQSALPPTGPQPVNLLSVGLYLNNPHSNNSGVGYVAFGDFNGDGKKDIVVVDGSTCVSVFPGNGTGDFGAAPIDSCVLPNRGGFLVAPGDFNNDGILDLAVVAGNCCNPTDIYIMLLQGKGDGTFTYTNTTIGFSYPSQLGYSEIATSLSAAALIPGGNLDLVMTTTGGNANKYTSYILLGNGSFGFTQSYIAGLGSCPNASSGVIADFNHDGIPDLAVTTDSCGLHEVDIMLGKGDGTFQPAVGYSTNTGSPSDPAVGDVNGDGNLDIVVIEGAGGNPITAFLGNGDGTFGKAIDTTSVYNPNFLAVGDFNGDGKADVVVSSNYSGGYTAGVQLSNGDGTFGPPVQYTVTTAPTRLFVDDLNGDGHPDWVSISNGSEYINVALGNGDGTFLGAVSDYTTPGTFGDGTTTMIAAADFNRDGNLDYATVGPDRNYTGLNIALGDGHGNFAAPAHYSAGANPAALTIGDFNKDGFPDIAVLDQNNDTVTVLLNSGTGTFPSGVSYQVGRGSGLIATADFNNDGKLDLIVTNFSDGTVSVLLGNGDGTFQAQQVSTAQSNADFLTVADFNNDGKLDVAVSYYNSTTISILLGNGDGTFQAPLSATGPDQDNGLVAGDFNKDGIVDLAVVSQTISNGSGGNGGVAILLGTGGGHFQAPVNYPTTPAGLSGETINGLPQLGDLNKDGNLDIVVSNNNSYASGMNIGPAILLGNGDGTFTLNPAKAAVTGANEGDVALGDFNNDGSLDVAVENVDPFNGALNLNTVTMLLSTGGTEVVLTSKPNPSVLGSSVTFTATVTTSFKNLPVPTGTMTFDIGSTMVPVTLVNGVATTTTSTLPLGRTLVHAVYSGDANFNPSTSMGLNQTVKPAPLKITTKRLADAVQNVAYSATVVAVGGTPPYAFSISSGTLPMGLSLNSSTGVISGTPTGLPGTSSFTVQVKDSGTPVQTVTANLSIIVASNLMITTSSLPNGVVGNSYNATLAATGGIPPYKFSVTSGALPAGLSLSTNGVISGKPTGPAGTANFTVQAKDSAIPAQTATANLSLTVTPALSITTTSLPNGLEASHYNASVAATGGITLYNFTVSSGSLPSGLSLNSSSGAISGTPTSAGTSNFTIQVKDSSSPAQVATANLSITIVTNLKITTTSLPNGVVGNAYTATLMASGGTLPYSFSITSGTLPAGLSLNSTTGVISGTPTGPAGTANLTVQVKDSNNPPQTATANLSLTVTGALMITTTSLPNGTEGVAYSASVVATGGVQPYTFAVISGNLPAGLSLNTSSGIISGTPTGSGTSSFTVQAKDSSSPAQTATVNLSITVIGTLTITTTSLPNGEVGKAYSATIMAGGGNPPYTFAVISGNLPAGLSLNSSSGVISGTPTGSGASSFTLQVKDSSSPMQTATANLSITVVPKLIITTTSLPPGMVGVSYSAAITASGGTPSYTFSIISGALPAGLSLNSSSGAITGTPTKAGLSNFIAQVQDSSNPANKATARLSIMVTNPLKIITKSVPNGIAGIPYSATIMASGGTPPYTFSITSGQLPFGLSLSTGGVISSTPTQPFETETFTVQVQDSGHPLQTATATFTMTIEQQVMVCTGALPNGTVGVSYSASICVQGGTSPYTFSITSGALPQGLSLNASSGVISGTPTQTGTSNFTLKVTDSGHPMQKATANLSITINP